MIKYAPSWVTALLSYLDSELCRVMWNIHQKDYESPFQNTGNDFKTDVFEVRAYYWGDDEEEEIKPNFKCGKVEISWYKWYGRGTRLRGDYSTEEIIDAFNQALLSILQYEYEQCRGPYETSPPTMELILGG